MGKFTIKTKISYKQPNLTTLNTKLAEERLAEINEVKNTKIAKVNGTKSWFYKDQQNWQNFNLIKKKEKKEITKIRSKSRGTTNAAKIKRIIRRIYKQLFAKN